MKRDDVILLYSNGIILFRKTVLFLTLFFLLFSSHSKALFYSPFGSCHYPQKLKRIPASILHLFETSAPKFLV